MTPSPGKSSPFKRDCGPPSRKVQRARRASRTGLARGLIVETRLRGESTLQSCAVPGRGITYLMRRTHQGRQHLERPHGRSRLGARAEPPRGWKMTPETCGSSCGQAGSLFRALYTAKRMREKETETGLSEGRRSRKKMRALLLFLSRPQ